MRPLTKGGAGSAAHQPARNPKGSKGHTKMYQGRLPPAKQLPPGTSTGEERRAETQTRAQLYLLRDLGALMEPQDWPCPDGGVGSR